MDQLFVFTADLHLEDGAWSTRPGIYGDAYYSFAQIVEYCIEHHLPLILGGDVLEKKSNSARPIAKLCKGMDRMRGVNLDVFYIQGNHEYDRAAPWLSVHDWPEHIHQKMIRIGGTTIYGLDWLPKGEIQQALATVPETAEILIVHQVWDDFMKGLGRTECSLPDVHHVKTVLAGDFHPTVTAEGVGAQGQAITMLSPGSICMQDLSESPTKWFFVICRAPDGSIHFERKALETRPFAKFIVNDQEYLDQLCAGGLSQESECLARQISQTAKAAGIDKPIVRIKFDKNLPDAFLRLTTAAGDACHLFCEALADKGQAERQQTTRSSAKNDLLAALGDLLGDETPAYKLAAALVTAEDPAKKLEGVFAEFQEGTSHAAVATGSPELGAPSAPSV